MDRWYWGWNITVWGRQTSNIVKLHQIKLPSNHGQTEINLYAAVGSEAEAVVKTLERALAELTERDQQK